MNDSRQDDPDIESLARQFLDLWQDQFAAMAADPQLLAAMTRTFRSMVAPGMSGVPDEGDGDEQGGSGATGTPTGSAASGAASVDIERHLDELRRRVDALEKRVDELASDSRGGGRRTGKRTGGSGSRAPGTGGRKGGT